MHGAVCGTCHSGELACVWLYMGKEHHGVLHAWGCVWCVLTVWGPASMRLCVGCPHGMWMPPCFCILVLLSVFDFWHVAGL